MDNITVLQVEKRLDDLSDYVPSSVFREAFLASELLIKVSVLTVLEHNVDVLGIVEVSVKLNDIWVVKSPLNFQLSLHLWEKVKLLKHLLEDNFECTWDTCRALHCLEHFAELAATDCLDSCEVMLAPALTFLVRGLILMISTGNIMIVGYACRLCHFVLNYSLRDQIILEVRTTLWN